MNNEPVAWIPFAWYCAWLGENNEPVWEQYEECHPATKQWDNFPDKIIPLYTHPVKELTDEVIEQVRVAIMGAAYWCADENMPEAYNAVKVCCGQVLGILVKAQEK